MTELSIHANRRAGVRPEPEPWQGALRSMGKATRGPDPRIRGGKLHTSRDDAQLLALHPKAWLEVITMPVCAIAPSLHRR